MADMQDDEIEIINLSFDDGSEVECEILGTFMLNDKTYVAVTPNDEDAEDIYLFGYTEEEDEYDLFDIEDDEEYAAVEKEFARLIDEIME